MKIITVGDRYFDIDGYAGITAYAELCNLLGIPAKAVSPAPFNASITKTVKTWPAELSKAYENPSQQDTFTVIDLSDPKYVSSFVDIDRVDEVIDHHPGFEQFWHDKIGDKAQIEMVGAACTLVFERWQSENMLDKMSQTSARLLVCGILDNTLNFGAIITTKRDHDAYNKLLKKAKLPENWPAIYFGEAEESILLNPVDAIFNDTKTPHYKTYNNKLSVGQIAVWDAKELLKQHHQLLKQTMQKTDENWFINILCIGEKRSYFITDNTEIKHWLTELLGTNFVGDIAVASRMWLRKEIAKQDIIIATPKQNKPF